MSNLFNDDFLKLPFNEALFYEAEFGMRFSLHDSSVESMIILQALYRSWSIYSGVFTGHKHFVLLEFYTTKTLPKSKKQQKRNDLKAIQRKLRSLTPICQQRPQSAKFIIPKDLENGLEVDMMCTYYAYEIDGNHSEHVVDLLWSLFANNFPHWMKNGVCPSIHFYDPGRKIIFHPYDDRGADLIAQNKDAIQNYYHQFNDWILAYDRERIATVFG